MSGSSSSTQPQVPTDPGLQFYTDGGLVAEYVIPPPKAFLSNIIRPHIPFVVALGLLHGPFLNRQSVQYMAHAKYKLQGIWYDADSAVGVFKTESEEDLAWTPKYQTTNPLALADWDKLYLVLANLTAPEGTYIFVVDIIKSDENGFSLVTQLPAFRATSIIIPDEETTVMEYPTTSQMQVLDRLMPSLREQLEISPKEILPYTMTWLQNPLATLCQDSAFPYIEFIFNTFNPDPDGGGGLAQGVFAYVVFIRLDNNFHGRHSRMEAEVVRCIRMENVIHPTWKLSREVRLRARGRWMVEVWLISSFPNLMNEMLCPYAPHLGYLKTWIDIEKKKKKDKNKRESHGESSVVTGPVTRFPLTASNTVYSATRHSNHHAKDPPQPTSIVGRPKEGYAMQEEVPDDQYTEGWLVKKVADAGQICRMAAEATES